MKYAKMIMKRLRAIQLQRTTYNALKRLDDRMLADIGCTRGDIMKIGRGQLP